MKLRIATCQLPVGADIARNARFVMRQMSQARSEGADVAHFCEAALSVASSGLKSSPRWDV